MASASFGSTNSPVQCLPTESFSNLTFNESEYSIDIIADVEEKHVSITVPWSKSGLEIEVVYLNVGEESQVAVSAPVAHRQVQDKALVNGVMIGNDVTSPVLVFVTYSAYRDCEGTKVTDKMHQYSLPVNITNHSRRTP